MLARTKHGAKHRRERRRWETLVARGDVACCFCGELLDPGRPWDLAHDDGDANGRLYAGAAHPSCHRGEPNRNNVSRQW